MTLRPSQVLLTGGASLALGVAAGMTAGSAALGILGALCVAALLTWSLATESATP